MGEERERERELVEPIKQIAKWPIHFQCKPFHPKLANKHQFLNFFPFLTNLISSGARSE